MLLCCHYDNTLKGRIILASKLPMFGLRVPRELLKKIKFVADYNGRSANKEIEQLIIKHVELFEKEHGEIK